MKLPLLAAVSLLFPLSVPAIAQSSVVVPNALANVEGPGRHEMPSHWNVGRGQFLYNKTVINLASAMLTGVRMRRDAGAGTWIGQPIQIKIYVSSTGVPAPEYSDIVYATNHGTDRRQVFQGNYTFPQQMPTAGPARFAFEWLFSVPFAYRGQHLMVDIELTGTLTPSDDFVDGTAGVTVSPFGSGIDLGTGCPTGFLTNIWGARVAGTGSYSGIPYPGAALGIRGDTQSGRPLSFMVIAGNSKTSFLTVPLPFNLGQLGGPGCALYTNAAAVFVGVTDGNGTVALNLGRLPEDDTLKRARLFFQTIALDPTYNRIALRAAAGVEVILGGGFPRGLETYSWFDTHTTPWDRADYHLTRAPVIQLLY